MSAGVEGRSASADNRPDWLQHMELYFSSVPNAPLIRSTGSWPRSMAAFGEVSSPEC